METTDLTRAMNAATDELTPRPGFTEDVLRGGRRRANRRRIGGAAVLAAVVGVVTITAVDLGPATTAPAAPHSDWPHVTGPTRGDLAGDEDYLTAVRQAWEEGIARSPNSWAERPATGDVHVVWAGTTPMGPAALVAQGVTPEDAAKETASGPPALGLLAGESPVLVSERPPDVERPVAFLFGGSADRMLVTLDRGEPLRWSHWAEGGGGKGTRTWRDVPTADGVGLVLLPEGTPATVVVKEGADQPVAVLPASRYREGVDRQSKVIPQRDVIWPIDRLGVDGATGTAAPNPYEVLVEAGYADPEVPAAVTGFHAVADLGGGRTVTAYEFVPAIGAGSRFYAVITDAAGKVLSVTHGGRLALERPLPARVRLPDGQGWVVAQHGASLAFRPRGDVRWQPLGAHAALVPDVDGGQVRVTTEGEPPVVVTLG